MLEVEDIDLIDFNSCIQSFSYKFQYKEVKSKFVVVIRPLIKRTQIVHLSHRYSSFNSSTVSWSSINS